MLTSSRAFRAWTASDELRGAGRCLLALGAVISFGTLGFFLVERDWGLWKSLFFTLITITTVGYGDEGLSPRGEMFAAVLLLMGIGTATYSLSELVRIAVTYQAAGKRKMQNRINRLCDHFVICGFGRIGQSLARHLTDARVPFVIVDSEPRVIDKALEAGYLALLGNSTDDEVLKAAGTPRARGVICAISSDAENTFVTLCARELNPELFIASRASTDRSAQRIQRAGADVVVSPYSIAGLTIADAILRPRMAEFLRNHRGSEIELGDLTVTEQSELAGQTVREVGSRFPRIAFVAVQRGDQLEIRPGGTLTFALGDRVTMAGCRTELETISSHLLRK